nr:CotH kinase family protein [Bacteroidota bacterium]
KGGLDLDERTFNHQITYFNGNYWGVYELRERLDSDYTEYYYGQTESDIDLLKYWGGLNVEYGSNVGWNNLFNYVNANDLSIQANYDYVLTQIDKENFIDNFILNTFMVNSDWLNWNTMWWRGNAAPGVKWRYALWDLDNIADLGQNYTGWAGGTGPSVNTVCNMQNMFQNSGASNGHAIIYNKLLENEDFFWSYVNRYADLLNTALHCDTLNALLDDFEANMLPEMPGQFNRWGGNMTAWQQNIQDIRNFNCTRWNLVMEQIVDCFDEDYPISGPYELTVQIVGDGDVQVNTITIPAGPWSGSWFGGAEMAFEAIPGLDSYFSHWEIDQNYAGQDLLDPSTWLQLLTSDTITAYFTSSPLPIELVSFDGKKVASDVHLDWITATELNSSHFNIERRTSDDVGWQVIDRVEAAGNSVHTIEYRSIDGSPANGINYYRLHQVDIDGTFSYSHVVAVEFQDDAMDLLQIWPNPTNNDVTISNISDQDLHIDLVAADGRWLKKIWLAAGKQRWYDLDEFSAGVYFLQMQKDGAMKSQRLVVLE